MHIVYILQSEINTSKHYVGITNDVNRRLTQHNNAPSCSYTRKYKPWKLQTYVIFERKEAADKFEIYLKKPSGKAFMRKHLL